MNYLGLVQRFIEDNFPSYYTGFRWIKSCQKSIDLSDERINSFVTQLISLPDFSLPEDLSEIKVADVFEKPSLRHALVSEVFARYRNLVKTLPVKIIAKDGVEIEVPRKFFIKSVVESMKPDEALRLPNISAEVIRGLLKEFNGEPVDFDLIRRHALELVELDDIYRNFPKYLNLIATQLYIKHCPLNNDLFKACLKLGPKYPHVREDVNNRLALEFNIENKISVECDWELGEIYVSLQRIDQESLEKFKQALDTLEGIFAQVSDENLEAFPSLLALIAPSNSIRSIQFDNPLREHLITFLNWLRFDSTVTAVYLRLSKDDFQTHQDDVIAILQTVELRRTETHLEVPGGQYLPLQIRLQCCFCERSFFLGLHNLLSSAAKHSAEINNLFQEFKTKEASIRPSQVGNIFNRLNTLLTVNVLRSSTTTAQAYRALLSMYPELANPVEIASVTLRTHPPKKRKSHSVDERLTALTFPLTLDPAQRGLYFDKEPYIIDKIVRFITLGDVEFTDFDDTVGFLEVALELHLDFNFIDKCIAEIECYLLEPDDLGEVFEYVEKIRQLNYPRLNLLLSKRHRLLVDDKPVLWSVDKKGSFHLYFSEFRLNDVEKIKPLIGQNALSSCSILTFIDRASLVLFQNRYLDKTRPLKLLLASGASADLSGLDPSFIKTIEYIPLKKEVLDELKVSKSKN